tara:strand:- start:332 stop:1537 length:1206 start_codon:yes stop_codon:yes gene_type:complete
MGLASLITFLFIPVLTRLFSAEEFGQWVIFMMLMQTISLFTFKFEMSIVLPKDSKKAIYISIFSILILFFTSLLSFLIIFLLKDVLIFNFFPGLSPILLLLAPLGGFLLGFYNILQIWSTREHYYRQIAYSQVLHSSISSPVSVILYFFGYNSALGLALGQLIARLSSLYYLFNYYIFCVKKIQIRDCLKSFKKLVSTYKSFPFFEFPQSVLHRFSFDIIFYFVAFSFGSAAVGLLTIADRTVAKPLNIISESLKLAFYQRLTVKKDKVNFFIQSIILMFFLGSFFVGIIYLIPDSLYDYFLGGEQWGNVGVYIRLLLPLIFVRFVFVMASGTIAYKLKNHITLIWRILYLCILIYMFSSINFINEEHLVWSYSLIGAVMYFLLGILSFLILKNVSLKHID